MANTGCLPLDGKHFVYGATLKPRRAGTVTIPAYAYGLNIDSGSRFFVGGAATKSRLLNLGGTRPAGLAATGDSNDAVLYLSANNYAANDANFIFRGINAAIANRSGGTLGRIEHSLGTQQKSGGTCPTVMGLSVTSENYGTCATLFGGIDVLLKNEAAVATTEFGLRLRNENNSIAGPVANAIMVSKSGANTGFTNLLNLGASAGCFSEKAGTYSGSGNTVGITIVANGTTYHLIGHATIT